MKRTGVRLAAAIGAFCWASVAGAQSIEVQEIDNPSAESGFYVRASYGHRFDANIDEVDIKGVPGSNNVPGNGDFSTNDVRGEVGGTIKFSESIRWANYLGYGFNNYDSDAINADVNNLTWASLVGWDMDRNWSILFGPVVSAYAQWGADWGKSISAGGVFGTVYHPTRDLSVGLALVTVKRFEDDISLLPVLMTNWNFARDWNLRTGMTEVAARRGIGATVAWSFARDFQLLGGLQFENRRFRQDRGDLIVNDRSLPIFASVQWDIVEGLSLSGELGVAVGGQLKQRDKNDDHTILIADYDAAPILGVRLQYALSGL